MPGFLLHAGATVQCLHAGQALPAAPNPRVRVSGQPTVTQTTMYNIAGCPNPPPPANVGPCVTAQWGTGSLRVKSGGLPLLLQDSQAICVPAGSLDILATQTRVKGT